MIREIDALEEKMTTDAERPPGTIHCPICARFYEQLLPYNNRVNALCPGCKSLERHRFIFLLFRDLTGGGAQPLRLLHFAPELGLSRHYSSSPRIDYYTADSMALLNNDLQAKPDFVMSITDIGFEENVFDWVICSHVLDDVEDDRKALSEIFRVLKVGGRALLSVPFDPMLKETVELMKPEAQHLRKQLRVGWEDKRRYGLDFLERVEHAGFEVTVFEPQRCFDLAQYALLPTDFVFLATKSKP